MFSTFDPAYKHKIEMNNFFVKLIKNPYVLNLLLAVVVACALVYGTLKRLDKYTRHNEGVVVRGVRGLGV